MNITGIRPPLAALTPNDHGPLVIVFAASAACMSVTFAAVRTLVAIRRKIEFQTDDFVVFLALATSIAQSVTWILASKHGLGRHISTVSADTLALYFKYTYSSHILGIVAMTLSKMSVALLLRRLSVYNTKYLHSYLLIIGVGVFSVLSLLLQCKTPSPWNASPANCPAREGIWFVVIIFNILTDALLSIYIIPGVWRLNMAKNVRITVIALFSSRLFVCAASIAQIIDMAQELNSSDFTWTTVPFAILTNTVVHLSLITSILPRVHSFLATLGTGQNAAKVSNSSHHRNPLAFLRFYVSAKTRNDSAFAESVRGNLTLESGPHSSNSGPDDYTFHMSEGIHSSYSGGSVSYLQTQSNGETGSVIRTSEPRDGGSLPTCRNLPVEQQSVDFERQSANA